VGKGAPDTKANRLKLIDYFIKRIKHYYNGGILDTENAEIVNSNQVEDEVNKYVKSENAQETDWQQNKYRTWYKAEKGTFKNGDQEIQVWRTGPFRLTGNEAGKLQPSVSINYDEVMLQDGHVWVGYTSFEGERLYLPVRTWDGTAPPNQGLGELWGSIN
ncbi:SH3 domain-containing protein, partial [Staphylococcus xylosus]